MQLSPSLSTILHELFDLIKKFLASDAESGFFSTIFHMLFELIKKVMAPDAVLYLVKKDNLSTTVAVVVISLLIYSFCGCLTKTSGKTMKAPGQNLRIPRKGFEENPSAYFRNMRNK